MPTRGCTPPAIRWPNRSHRVTASRSATKQYRTPPLKGVWQRAPYFHDGSAATLSDVVRTYDRKRGLGLTEQQVGRPERVPEVPVMSLAANGVRSGAWQVMGHGRVEPIC